MEQRIQKPRHILGTRAKVLLSSVFGPYAQDDEFGSRSINPMELYHNQVTRTQRGFSLRMFHRSFGLMLLQANIEAPCTLLDFPTLERFTEELERNPYDIVGISAIIPNIGKAKKMCELVRDKLPKAKIVVGGHVANMPGVERRLDADYIVKGDGVRWFREFLGQDPDAPIRHPVAFSAMNARTLGVRTGDSPQNTAAILIPSVGCPMGCNFCATSAMFGGKGKFINFYETGDELFSVMSKIEAKLKTRSFFILDENFLLHKRRALRLLELMEENQKSWSLYVFSSGHVLKSYSIEQLLALGVSWVWLGLESEENSYRKLDQVDTKELVNTLQSNGIHVLGSSIIGMEHHRPEQMDGIIDYAVSHRTDFHQFMLYTPVMGTPLYNEHEKGGLLLSEEEMPLADTHGQYRFCFRHPHIRDGSEESYLLQAFMRDFNINGPSVIRIIWTTFRGWMRHRNHPNPRIRKRILHEARELKTSYAGALWAACRYFKRDKALSEKLKSEYREFIHILGLKARLMGPLLGCFLLHSVRREERRVARGVSYEPPFFYEVNAAAAKLKSSVGKPLALISVTP